MDLNLLADYVRGLLDNDRTEEVDAHLAECMSCLDEVVRAESLLEDNELAVWEPVSRPLALSRQDAVPFWDNLKDAFSFFRRFNDQLNLQPALDWVPLSLVPLPPEPPFGSFSAGSPQFGVAETQSPYSDIYYICMKKKFGTCVAGCYFEKWEGESFYMEVRLLTGKTMTPLLELHLVRFHEIDDKLKQQDPEVYRITEDGCVIGEKPFGMYKLELVEDECRLDACAFQINESGFLYYENIHDEIQLNRA